MSSLWAWVAGFLRAFVRPIRDAAAKGPQAVTNLVCAAAGSVNSHAQQQDIDAVNALAAIISDFEQDMDSMSAADVDLTKFLNLTADFVTAMQAFFGGGHGISPTLIAPMLEYLEFAFFRGTTPTAYTTLGLIGVIDETQAAGKKIDWTKLKYLFDPPNLMKDIYGWGTSNFNGDLFLRRVANFAAGLGVAVDSKVLLGPIQQIVDADAFNSGDEQPFVVLLPVFQRFDRATASTVAAGLVLIPVSGAGNPNDPGIALVPIGAADFGNNQLGPNWQISFDASGSSGYAVIFRPSGVQVAQLPGASASVDLKATLSSTWAAAPTMNLGGAFETSVQAIQVTVDTKLQTPPTFSLGVEVQGFQFKVDPGDADGFLQSVLPSAGLQGRADLGVIWSPRRGIQFSGGIGLQINIPIHESIGPINLEQITIEGSLSGPPASLTLAATLDAGVALGPIAATVKGVGVAAAFGITTPAPGDPSQFGPFGVQVKFQPPSGLGLLIDAGLVSGGGYIAFDPDKGQYAGVLDVSLADIVQVKVIAVLDTKMPDGSSGYSFLFIITFDLPAIQLSFGFTLNGVGGLGGVNRTMVQSALQSGLRNHQLNSILFPPDPITNAPQIVSDIESFFPPQQGRYLFGPMFSIGWGTPTLLDFEVGVILEVPDPVRLAILGMIRATIPSPDTALIQLKIDVLGTVDFGLEKLAIDGTMYDSYVVEFQLSGDLALRFNWGNNANFLFSLGGFNPKFAPPPDVPALRRLSVSLGMGDNPRLSANSYLAVTSNSLQFGANVDAYASAGGFAVHGYVGFDTLFIFSPFSFEIDFSAGFDISYDGASLAGIHLDATLSGATPFHLHGDASFHILFFDVSASIDLKWGNTKQAILPSVPVLDPLLNALQDTRNWSVALPPQSTQAVSLRQLPAAAGQLIVHPMGTLSCRETVVPLDCSITLFNNAPPADGHEYSITSVLINDVPATTAPNPEQFAIAQFTTMSDADKLSAQSYESFGAGVKIGFAAIINGNDSPRDVVYQDRYIDDYGLLSRAGSVYRLPAGIHAQLAASGACATSPTNTTGLRTFVEPSMTSPIEIAPLGYTIASTLDLSTRVDLLPTATTQYSARVTLDAYLNQHPDERDTLQVLPLCEAMS
jgi:hypothetical protein